MKTNNNPLPVESLADAMQDSVHKECDGVRAAVSGRPPCNPMATQCPRCNNSVAECDFGRYLDRDHEMARTQSVDGPYWASERRMNIEAHEETEIIDRLFLELSQFTKAKTKRDLQLDELLYAVARTFPGETRFETALRYIMEAEATAIEGPAPAIDEALRLAVERTRDDLGPDGTNYPDVRKLLEFAEGHCRRSEID